MRRRRWRERGQSLAEFSFVLPLFLVVAMATVDFGWALRSYITITNAAREGARVGITGASESQIVEKTTESADGLLEAADVEVVNAAGAPGSALEVLVDYDYRFITPLGGFISKLTGGSFPAVMTLSTKTTMRLE